MAKYIPRGRFNPGPFNRKEHTLICIAASTATSSAYAIDILTVQRIYYKQNIGALASLLLLWTTQCLGYGMAGFLREYLVKPPKMVWPIILPNVAVFNTLHGGDSASSAALSRKRYKFFFTVLIFTTLYQLLPNFFAPVLTWVSVICIAGGRNLSSFWSTLAGGVSNGGFLNISLDWSAVGGRYPLYAPLWAQMNEYVSSRSMMVEFGMDCHNSKNFNCSTSYLQSVSTGSLSLFSTTSMCGAPVITQCLGF